MEAITQLVAESLARHGFDRPVDPRRLQWSRWFRCDSPHSLLVVPSKPGIFALAEEIVDLRPEGDREGHDFSRAVMPARNSPALAAAGMADGNQRAECARRMLAVLQFSEDDDMAFTLDRMFTRINPMRARLASGRCYLRFVVVEDQAQRRNICTALNQWMINSAQKATGIATDFSSSLELSTDRVEAGASPANADNTTRPVGTDAFVRPADSTARVGRTLPSASSEPALSLSKGQAMSDSANSIPKSAQVPPPKPGSLFAPLDSAAAKNLHCPHPLPSGF